MATEKRPRISEESLERLDELLDREFGVDPDLIQYEGKIQLLMGHFDADAVDDVDENDAANPSDAEPGAVA